MRLLALGDVHGCLRSLTLLAESVPFSTCERIVTLGDYVDRGPDSRGVLDWLIEFSATGKLVPLQGNHELMMIRSRISSMERNSWLINGGFQTLLSYSPGDRPGKVADVPETHWAFLSACAPYFSTDEFIFVHAHVDPDEELENQSEQSLFWTRFTPQPVHRSGKRIICGHTPQKSGLPRVEPHGICLDTFACGGGWLTALDVTTGDYWQANEEGEQRTGRLDDICLDD